MKESYLYRRCFLCFILRHIIYTLDAELFLPFSIIAASFLFLSTTNFLVKDTYVFPHFYEYRIIILGVSYLLIGYSLFLKQKYAITELLYLCELVMLLGTGFFLQGFKPHTNTAWTILFPALVVLVYYSSIKIQSKIFLAFGTLFTFIEVLKFTYEYFSDTLGWPVALMIAGLVIMVLGYASFVVNKQFLATKLPEPL